MYLNFINEKLDYDVYIKRVEIRHETNFFLPEIVERNLVPPFDQIQQVCYALQDDPKLANGYNAIGLSQGALFL